MKKKLPSIVMALFLTMAVVQVSNKVLAEEPGCTCTIQHICWWLNNYGQWINYGELSCTGSTESSCTSGYAWICCDGHYEYCHFPAES